MIISSPVIPRRPVGRQIKIFRGVDEKQRRDALDVGFIAPRRAMRDLRELLSLLRSRMPVDHVLARRREHAVSWSTESNTAIWWATGLGRRPGYVVQKSISLTSASGVGGAEHAFFYAAGSTEWLVSREVIPPAFSLAGFVDWRRAVALASADWELLQVAGQVPVTRRDFMPVTGSDCRPGAKPVDAWIDNVEAIS